MSGAAFILAINISIAGLLALAFAAIAFYERSYVSARWFAATYGVGVLYALTEFSLPFLGGSQLALTITFALFLAATALLNLGLAALYGQKLPWQLLAALCVLAIGVQVFTSDFGRDSIVRLFAYQGPYFIMQVLGAAIVLRAGPRGRSAMLLVLGLSLSALHFLTKPFVALATGGPGRSSDAYMATNYALYSQTAGTVLAVAIALTILFILTRRLLADASRKARTDSLSGLLNRGGFEDGLGTLVSGASGKGLPIALVLADLDHFKSVNDNYGHAAGDLVISTFAQKLKGAADAHFAIGRIGGEEFAVALPGYNLTAARLYAETVRASFETKSVPGLPPDVHFTASFGVTEIVPGESFGDMLARADRALYEAKAAGRNCVRVDAPKPQLLPPAGDRRRFRS